MARPDADAFAAQVIEAEQLRKEAELARAMKAVEKPAPRGRATPAYVRDAGKVLTPDVPLRQVEKPQILPQTPQGLDIPSLAKVVTDRLESPADMSGLAEINRIRDANASRDYGQGLYQSILGGKHMKESGAQILRKSLEDREPIRPNAADIGWTNPDTGEVVMNPIMEQNKKVSVAQHNLDQAIKMKEFEIQEARRLGDQALAEQKHKELLAILGQKNALTIIHENNAADTADAKGAGKGAKLPFAMQKELEENVSNLQTLDRLSNTMDKKYFGGKGVFSQAGLMLDTAKGGMADPATREKVGWWKDYKSAFELLTRHKLFGSAVTANETALWNAAQAIHPGSNPDDARKALSRLYRAAAEKHTRSMAQHKNDRYNVDAYEAKFNVPADPDAVVDVPLVPPAPKAGQSEVDAIDAALKRKEERKGDRRR